MADPSNPGRDEELGLHEKMLADIKAKQDRKLRARRTRNRSMWFGLGMMGTVGWSVVVPTLVGVAIGLWIDTSWPGRFSWTLALLVLGLITGCVNAWMWLVREQESIQKDKEEDRNE